MTIEGAIVQLQELIDNNGIPFWAKPSLQKVMETVEMEREQYIEAQQERKTGKWISATTSKGWHCSECVNNDPETGKWVEVFDFRYPYCPNCGAKMEVDE